MNLSSIEQETIINYNQGEAEATVFTYDKALIRKLEPAGKSTKRHPYRKHP